MRYVKPGSVISIPLPSGGTCSAVVLFVSRYFRNVMLIGFLADDYQEGGEYTTGQLCDSIKALVYTSQVSVREGDWPIVGNITLPDVAPFTERLDAGDVWILDQEVRVATPEDKAVLPVMSVAGEGAVESLAEEIANKRDYGKGTKRDIKYTESLFGKIRSSNR